MKTIYKKQEEPFNSSRILAPFNDTIYSSLSQAARWYPSQSFPAIKLQDFQRLVGLEIQDLLLVLQVLQLAFLAFLVASFLQLLRFLGPFWLLRFLKLLFAMDESRRPFARGCPKLLESDSFEGQKQNQISVTKSKKSTCLSVFLNLWPFESRFLRTFLHTLFSTHWTTGIASRPVSSGSSNSCFRLQLRCSRR